MKEKTCLVIYIGNGYSEKTVAVNQKYVYSVDMRDNRENHDKYIFQPLKDLGYKVDTAIVTNKHKHYNEFLKEYSAINLEYDDFESRDTDILYNYYALKFPREFGPGWFSSGGRFLKLKEEIPKYDTYVFVRADTWFKKSLKELNVKYHKINYLWPETDINFFSENRDSYMKVHGTELVYWNDYKRVSGNILNVVGQKYIKIFLNYFWLEHMSLCFMLKDLSPLITYEKDVNMMCGDKTAYSSDVAFCINPVYTFNKKIIYNFI